MTPETMHLVKFISEWSGSLGLFLGFLVVSRRWADPQSKMAIIFNLIGSAGFMVLNYLFRSWPGVALNVMWFAIGAYGLMAKPPKRTFDQCLPSKTPRTSTCQGP